MLEKLTKEDVGGFQCYTIRDMSAKSSTNSDIEQYRLLGVKQQPIDNRIKHLDVMCYPVLFPDRNFGKFHPREVNLSHSKSRLYYIQYSSKKLPVLLLFYEKITVILHSPSIAVLLLHCTEAIVNTI